MIIASTSDEIRNRGCTINLAAVPAGLKRGELTPNGKREHLYGKGIRGAEAEAVVEQLYGPLPHGSD